MKFRKMVYFEWIDCTAGDGWTSHEEAKEINIHGCQAGGLFVSEDSEKIIIALLNDPHGERVSEYAAVPKVNIKPGSRVDINIFTSKDEDG